MICRKTFSGTDCLLDHEYNSGLGSTPKHLSRAEFRARYTILSFIPTVCQSHTSTPESSREINPFDVFYAIDCFNLRYNLKIGAEEFLV